MSITDATPDAEQPETGQDGGGEPGGQPYADYLERVPEESRGDIEPIFKDWNANVNRRFEEHAEQRKNWEPYEQLGLRQYDPQTVNEALQLYQAAANDPQAFKQWFDGYAQERGLVEQQQQQGFDEFFDQGQSQQQLEQLLSQKLQPVEQQFQEFMQWREQLEQGAMEQQIQSQLDAEIAALKQQHGENLPEKIRGQFEDLIERFAGKYAEPGADPKRVIAKAWEDVQAVLNAADRAALQSKVGAPGPAEGGGVPDVSPEKFKRVKDLEGLALDFLKNQNPA